MQCRTCHNNLWEKISFTHGTVSVLQPCLSDRSLSLRSELQEGRRILPTWWHLFFFQTPVPRSQLPVSRFRLLTIVENSHKKGTSTTLNAVAKENIQVHAKVLVNLKPTKMRLSHASLSPSSQINSLHKSNLGNLKSETAAEKRKRAFQAYTFRQKCKSKQVCSSHWQNQWSDNTVLSPAGISKMSVPYLLLFTDGNHLLTILCLVSGKMSVPDLLLFTDGNLLTILCLESGKMSVPDLLLFTDRIHDLTTLCLECGRC